MNEYVRRPYFLYDKTVAVIEAILNSRLSENEIIIMIRYCHNWRVMESSSIWCVVAALENINQLIILS